MEEKSMHRYRFGDGIVSPSRRRFVQGVAGGALALSAAKHRAWASEGQQDAVLSGTEFDLEIGALPVNFTGEPRIATAVNGQSPAPLLPCDMTMGHTGMDTGRIAEIMPMPPNSIPMKGAVGPFGDYISMGWSKNERGR
jgi:hypothetical protein